MRKKKRSNFRGKVGKDAERQKRQASSYGYLNLPKGVNVFSPEPGGRAKLDFLPYEVTDTQHPDLNKELEIAVQGSLWYKHPFKTHRNIGVDNESVVCLTSIGKKCPICEKRSELIRSGADKEDTDALKPSLRNLYIVFPLDSKEYEAKPHIWDMSQWLFQNLLNEELEEDDDYAVFPDLEEGLTLKIRFDSKTFGKGKPFAEASRIDFLERNDQYTEDILDEVPNLDEVLQILSYKELEAKFLELDDEDIDNEEEEEKTAHTRTRKTSKPAPEEEEEPEKEEEEREEKAPSKRTRNRDKKKDEEENRCPYGHTFGEDCDEYPEDCDKCKIWDECGEEQDRKK